MPILILFDRQCLLCVVTIATIFGFATPGLGDEIVDESHCSDRLWLFSTRAITSTACRADLQNPQLSVAVVSNNGHVAESSLEAYLGSLDSERSVVFYIHGNRMEASRARYRGLSIYRKCRCSGSAPIDWVIWSWPSAQAGVLTHDARLKARRTDAQGLYLAWLLRRHAVASVPTTLIGYSFGGRIATGALHALAGGSLGGRKLPGPETSGVGFRAGLIAPAIASNWLDRRGYHSRASKNLDRLVLMYNRRDVILKRYWMIEKIRGTMALGFTGPTRFAPRIDGSSLPVRAFDCSPSIGIRHDELEYYTSRCRAGQELATLIDEHPFNL